jgi:hypothetical protein
MEITPCSRVTPSYFTIEKTCIINLCLYLGWTYLQAPSPATSKGRVSNLLLHVLLQLLENLFLEVEDCLS